MTDPDDETPSTRTAMSELSEQCDTADIDAVLSWLSANPAKADELLGRPSRPASQPTRFREWRTAQGWSLQETADLCGLSVAMLSRIERGERQLSPATKVSIGRRLGVSLSKLFEPERAS